MTAFRIVIWATNMVGSRSMATFLELHHSRCCFHRWLEPVTTFSLSLLSPSCWLLLANFTQSLFFFDFSFFIWARTLFFVVSFLFLFPYFWIFRILDVHFFVFFPFGLYCLRGSVGFFLSGQVWKEKCSGRFLSNRFVFLLDRIFAVVCSFSIVTLKNLFAEEDLCWVQLYLCLLQLHQLMVLPEALCMLVLEAKGKFFHSISVCLGKLRFLI